MGKKLSDYMFGMSAERRYSQVNLGLCKLKWPQPCRNKKRQQSAAVMTPQMKFLVVKVQT
jgi:hypothetical protein